jgi:type VI secretion system protein ImpA
MAYTTTPSEAEVGAGAEDAGAAPAAGEPASGPRIAGRVETREDVIKAIDAITDYYRRREPASPVPLVLQRAREWVSLDFLQVLEDIAPGSLDEARRVLASRGQGGG